MGYILFGLIVIFITSYFVLDPGTVKAKAFLTKLLLVWSSFLTFATFALLLALSMKIAEPDKKLLTQIDYLEFSIEKDKYKGELVEVQSAALNYADAVMYTHKLYDKNKYGFAAKYHFWREKVDSLSELDRKQSQKDTW